MSDFVTETVLKAMQLFNDTAANTFYQKLREGLFQTTRCGRCKKLFFPPRRYCPECFQEMEQWVDLPRDGSLYAWAQHDRGTRFNRPDVVGIVELQGVPLRVVGKINASAEHLVLGAKLVLAIQDFNGLSLLTFDPV